jgi:hypothetical protein
MVEKNELVIFVGFTQKVENKVRTSVTLLLIDGIATRLANQEATDGIQTKMAEEMVSH